MSAGPAGRRRSVSLAGVLLAAILVLALVLRLKGVSWGLPYSFVNADESTVVPKAAAAARGHLNPQFFFYPSLYFYLAGALYVLAAPVWWLLGNGDLLSLTSLIVDPGPYFLLARLLSVAMGTASVYLVYRLGRVAFGRPAGLLAALFLAVAPLHVAYSHMAVTDVTAVALALLALVLLQRAAGATSEAGADDEARDWLDAVAGRLAAERRAARWLVLGAVAAGLATSTKYNLGMLVLPATVAAVLACRAEAARRVAAGGRAALVWLRMLALRVYLPMLLAFVAASPFVVLDAPHFLRDFRRQSQIMDRGWLGFEHVGNGFWYNVTPNLTGAIGVVLVVLGAAGLGWALWRRTRPRPHDRALRHRVLRVHRDLEGAGRPVPPGDRAAAHPARGAPGRRARPAAAARAVVRRPGGRGGAGARVRAAAAGFHRLRPHPERHGHARGRGPLDRVGPAGRLRSSPSRTTARRWSARASCTTTAPRAWTRWPSASSSSSSPCRARPSARATWTACGSRAWSTW